MRKIIFTREKKKKKELWDFNSWGGFYLRGRGREEVALNKFTWSISISYIASVSLYKWNIFSSFADNMNILCCPCFSLHLLFFSFFFFPPLNPYQEVPLQQFLTWLIQVICWLYWMLLFIYTSARRKFNTLQWIIGKETQVRINDSFVCLMDGKAGDGHLN